MAIVVSGPQATGKTTLAMALGMALSVPVFSRDPLMQALRADLPLPVLWHGRWVPAAGLRLQTALLARQLELGQSAIIECIAPLALRREWRRMCLAAGGRFVSVECTCSDSGEHRARFERRLHAGRRARNWRYVTATAKRYQGTPKPTSRPTRSGPSPTWWPASSPSPRTEPRRARGRYSTVFGIAIRHHLRFWCVVGAVAASPNRVSRTIALEASPP